MPAPASDWLILGGGIAGCALAYHLARRRVGSVTLVEPRTLSAGATGRAAGVVTEQLWDRWDVEVTRESHAEYAELLRASEPDAYQRHGFVRFTRDPEAAETLDAARTRLAGWGVSAEVGDASDLARWVPGGAFGDVRAALYSPGDAAVRPSSVAGRYADEARRLGAELVVGEGVTDLSRAGDRWHLKVGSSARTARELVVAAGAWSKSILRRLGHPLPLTPYRTQAAVLRPTQPPEPFPTVHDVDRDVYVRLEDGGRILAGDGTESVEADPDRFVPGGDAAFLAHIAEALEARFPAWAASEVVGAWAGVCTATPDRHPVVGPVADAPALWVMTGFNGFGVMRAGGVARRLSDVLALDLSDEDIARLLGPADPRRFRGPVTDFPPRPGFTLEAGDAPRW